MPILCRVIDRSSSSFTARLARRWQDAQSMLCVGLDPDPARLPAQLPAGRAGVLSFCIDVIDATADLVCAFKPQIAYFSALGAEAELATLIEYVHSNHPGVPVILDAKRGDIGDTAERYAVEAFERYDADAVTVNAFLGPESVAPFLAYAGRGVVVLCRTSNRDSGWLQCYPAERPVFLRIAAAARAWNRDGNVMLVAGATYADDLRRIRETVDDMPLLVPGIGVQGGDLETVVDVGLDRDGWGLVINASRSVLYAGSGADYAAAARRAALTLRDDIRRLRNARMTARSSL
jgi:orotidine-5'-phosphate decarboxylase